MADRMMRILSPHLDDAVLSLGQMMSTVPCEVVTVFAGTPDNVDLSDYDRARGFSSSREAMEMRRSEDHAAVELLRGRVRHLRYLDRQYQLHRPPTEYAHITIDLLRYFDDNDHTCAPLGLGHPDHRVVSDCALDACARTESIYGHEVLLYEELPYRVTNPEEVWQRLEHVRAEGWKVHEPVWAMPFPHTESSKFKKYAAIGCYRSQFPDGAGDPCLQVPERVWRCTR